MATCGDISMTTHPGYLNVRNRGIIPAQIAKPLNELNLVTESIKSPFFLTLYSVDHGYCSAVDSTRAEEAYSYRHLGAWIGRQVTLTLE